MSVGREGLSHLLLRPQPSQQFTPETKHMAPAYLNRTHLPPIINVSLGSPPWIEMTSAKRGRKLTRVWTESHWPCLLRRGTQCLPHEENLQTCLSTVNPLLLLVVCTNKHPSALLASHAVLCKHYRLLHRFLPADRFPGRSTNSQMQS